MILADNDTRVDRLNMKRRDNDHQVAAGLARAPDDRWRAGRSGGRQVQHSRND